MTATAAKPEAETPDPVAEDLRAIVAALADPRQRIETAFVHVGGRLTEAAGLLGRVSSLFEGLPRDLESEELVSSLHAGNAALRTYLLTGGAGDQAAAREAFNELGEHMEILRALTNDEPAARAKLRRHTVGRSQAATESTGPDLAPDGI